MKRYNQQEQQQMEGGGGVSSASPQATPQQLADIYTSNLPAMLGVTAGQSTPTAQAVANASAAANPIYTQSGLTQLQQLAPGYQQAGANLATQQAGTTTGLLNGAGGQAAQAATNLSNNLNPVQQASNAQATNLLNSVNLNGLSAGEQNATERSLNQSNYATGNLGLDNATNAVANAMNFGGAFNNKLGILGSALGSAGGVASNQNTFAQPVATALNAGNTSTNFGLGTFAPTQGSTAGTSALGFGSSIFGGQAQNASASNTNQMNSNAGICFLTTACCEWKGLADDCEELTILRNFRDTFVPPILVQEYYKLAKTIEPKIKNNREILKSIYNTIRQCVRSIKSGNNAHALNLYCDMVNNLKEL